HTVGLIRVPGRGVGNERRAAVFRPYGVSVTSGRIDRACIARTTAQAAPIDTDLELCHDAVGKRDARVAGDTTRFHFKLASANLLPAGVSDAGQCRHHKENGEIDEVLHHALTSCGFDRLRSILDLPLRLS